MSERQGKKYICMVICDIWRAAHLQGKMQWRSKFCRCFSRLSSPSHGGVWYRCYQVMTPTLDYPQWLVPCLSVTPQVASDQTRWCQGHPVEGSHSNSSSPPICAIWSCLSSSSSRWSSCMETALDATSGKGAASDMSRKLITILICNSLRIP